MQGRTMWSRRKFVASGLAGEGLTAAIPSVLAGARPRQESARRDVRIPTTMCHGFNQRLTSARFEQYLQIASELGFSTINYDQLYAWLTGAGILPAHPLIIDVDHPVHSVPAEMFPLMQKYGFTGNLFVNTGHFGEVCGNVSADSGRCRCASWDEIRQLMTSGWSIDAHTHTPEPVRAVAH